VRLAALAATAAVAVAGLAGAPTALGFQTGFTDVGAFEQLPGADRALALERVKAARGSIVRLMYNWRAIEKRPPPDDATATTPQCGCYDWSAVDSAVRDAAAGGLQVLLTTYYAAPSWWEGSHRPAVSARYPVGTWKPDAAAYGRFLTAAAHRYSGTFPDPAHPGATLPHVGYWQIWNEPNLYTDLNPQWTKVGHNRFREASPDRYRQLLSAAYDALKGVDSTNVVVTAGTAPFGEPWRGGKRIPPALFVRSLFCIDGRAHMHARNCRRTPAKFDVLAHHPYPIGPPGRHAINVDDVVIPDWAKLKAPLALAIRAGNVYPATPKPLWATEMSWDTSPPSPGGLAPETQARWLAGAMYVLWRQGVSVLTWFNLRDQAEGPGYDLTLQSGVYFRGSKVSDDRPKPSLRAFRFPFAVYRRYADFKGHGPSKLWGIAPQPGTVAVQTRADGKSPWQTILTLEADGNRIFQGHLDAKKGMWLRAWQGGEWSVNWQVF